MKSLLKALVPQSARTILRKLFNSHRSRIQGQQSPEKIFSKIYKTNAWGGEPGDYCSGSGTIAEEIASKYVAAVREFLKEAKLEGRRYVDLGCGDFRIGRRLCGESEQYIGVDVVPDLVTKLQTQFGSDKVQFVQRDLVKDPLPEGEVCFLRQVLQHMSNSQILEVLPKLMQYTVVLITEHQPEDSDVRAFNLDKPCGSTIRLERQSGVYLDKPPFSIASDHLQVVLEVPGAYCGKSGIGMMRTYAYFPSGMTAVRN